MLDYKDYEHLRFERRPHGVLLVTLDRPEALNAANDRMHWELTQVWLTIDRDPETRVAVVTGAGRAFSAGGDLEMVEANAADPRRLANTMREAADIVYNMINLDKPIVSAINGVAVGAGLVVALLADVSIIAEDVRLTDGHTRLGVAAGDHAAIIWPLLCGMAKAKYYLLTSDFIDGREAERIGLVSLCVPRAELLPRAFEIAERLALGILQRAFFGGNAFTLGCSIAPFDMRTMIYPFGRPETAFSGMAMAQIARFYGIPFRGHAGLTNAKLPSCEVGAQKALSALPILLASGHFHMDAGLLAVDEVCSPIQMILDNEFLSALQHLCGEFGASDEELAVEVIAEAGPGGHYVGADHTARHFRRELWEPTVWSREMLAGWMERGRPLDADHAAELYRDMRPSLATEGLLSPSEEKDILAIIAHAQANPDLAG